MISQVRQGVLWKIIVFVLIAPSFLVGQENSSTCLLLRDPQKLKALEAQVHSDLLKINFPRRPWVIHSTEMDDLEVLDVAIIGGGMAGMTAAFALTKEGISNIKIFDENPYCQEGPWVKCARMKALRSGKRYMGPALEIPSLTFTSWYEALYGKESWENLACCPTKLWHDYLCWFRHVLHLPVENKMSLVKLTPSKNLLELTFNDDGEPIVIYARKVVLATGREGSGGCKIPDYLQGVAKQLYAHTGEIIDPQFLNNKRIAIIGAGSSAFDAAGIALENGAKSVEMIVRRPAIPNINKFSQFSYPGLENGFYFLSDEMRCLFFAEAFQSGLDPNKAALERIKDYKNLHIHYNTDIQHVVDEDDTVVLQTNRQTFDVDFIVVGTGYEVDLSKTA